MSAETIGRYRIVKELGRGAMGRVLLAHDPEIDRPVAIKTVQIFASLPPQERDAARERFLREARAAGRLSHPGIVTVFDVGQHEGVPYLAMEYVRGQSLDTACRPETRLPVTQVAELVARVAEALDYAHRQGVIHRDVKPANLMRVGDADVKIMDFGLATDAAKRLDRESAVYGTPSYMSPEQIRGEDLDGRSDLFSLGCVLYEMVAGEKAFAGDSVSSVIYRVVHDRPGGEPTASERIPAALAPVLDRALAKSRDARFGTGQDMAVALRSAATGLAAVDAERAAVSGADVVATALPDTRVRRKHSGAWFVTGMVVVIAALALAAWWYTRQMRESAEPGPPSRSPATDVGPREGAGEAASQVPAFDAGGRRVRTEVRTDPPGLEVTVDGRPLEGGIVEFPLDGPFPVVEVTQDCRTVERALSASDAGGQVVVVPDPVRVDVVVDPGIAGGTVTVDDGDPLSTPAAVALDLCREHTLKIEAPRYRPTEVVVAAGSTPLEARTKVAGVELEPIPLGRVFPPPGAPGVRLYLDGEAVTLGPDGAEVEAGTHRLRVVDEARFVDVTVRFEVGAHEDTTPIATLPSMATLSVQSFPPNARVSLRRIDQDRWRFVATTPMTTELAAGRYRMRVESPSGAVRERDLDLTAGANPPQRVSFAGGDG